MRTEAGVRAMRRPMNPVTAAVKSFSAAKLIGLPLWKVIPGLLVQYDKMLQLAQFGAATEKLMAATIEGDLDRGNSRDCLTLRYRYRYHSCPI
jgi:enoyl-[acyl-carrier protein] reductase II